MAEIDVFHELSFYTLAHHDRSYFIHQHVVDAIAVQTADEDTKPIKLLFGLIGLYLYVECGYSGKEVQNTHILLSKKKYDWPALTLPEERGDIRVAHVMDTTAGPERDYKIKEWCASVWMAFMDSHQKIRSYIDTHLDMPK